MRVFVVAVFALVACAGPAPKETFPPRHLSVARHLEEAERHERLAEQNVKLAEQVATTEFPSDQRIHCVDHPLAGVTYSGGEPIPVMRPCWTSLTSPSAHYAKLAEQHRELAAWHRERARVLADTERLACTGLGEEEIATTPFAHTADLLRVEPYRESGRLRGTRVVFRPVPGLTAAWLTRSIHCHYARAAALGFPSDYLASCPATVPDVQISVSDEADGIAVTIRSERDEMAAAAYGRAQDLIADRGTPLRLR